MDRLNGINFNIGSVNNDLARDRAKEPVQDEPEKQPDPSPKPECKNVDPDKVLDAMKKHGLHNLKLNQTAASANKGSTKTITEAVDYFTNHFSPEAHTNLTNKVKAVFEQEFPASYADPDVIAEVVDELIFDKLLTA